MLNDLLMVLVVKAIRFGQRNYRKNHTILADVLTKHLTQRTVYPYKYQLETFVLIKLCGR